MKCTEEKMLYEKQKRKRCVDLVSNLYTLKHSGECADLRLMVDIKTQKRDRINAICKSSGWDWF